MSGRLFIIATPVGNLGDLTERAKQALASADLILVEDTRVTIKLINHLGLKKKLTSCHEYNEASRAKLMAEMASRDASVAVVSDAGTPLVSDPGYQIVQAAIECGMQVVPIPGPSAFLLALIGSALPCDRFVFEGFLPDRQKTRRKKLESMKDERRTLIFYVAPHDLVNALELVHSIMGDRQACLARELTKLHEEFIRGTMSEIISQVNERGVKGEYVLVIAGAEAPPEIELTEEELLSEIAERLKSGRGLKEVSQELAQELNRRRSDIYKLGLKCRDSDTEND
ncbi:MAG: 16S rRNA (cytidine(1402)-2'-O)-methyltransferase [Candidatus Obscuribacterales bacterium]|nr:16S rRNA (cytidine(1402)-2'-O)-methyltransferase [Candidatus Obscuribacterales bacterium]